MAIDQDSDVDKVMIAQSLEELFQLIEQLEQQVKNNHPSFSSEQMVAEGERLTPEVSSDFELFI